MAVVTNGNTCGYLGRKEGGGERGGRRERGERVRRW